MGLTKFSKRVFGWLGRGLRADHSPVRDSRLPQTHVIILDGTMSSLEPGHETNAGRIYRLLQQAGAGVTLWYEGGVQWHNWRSTPDVMMGRGINRQIRRAYGFLASRYRPGDRIFLLGYSRGAFAVRSLAGAIDQVGLLTAHHATERNVRQLYRHYEQAPKSNAARAFGEALCHPSVEIEVVGVFDTVKALGLRLPVLWRLTEERHSFHNHRLGGNIRHGFHALALDETREVFEPVLWESPDHTASDVPSSIEQMWFRGAHGDIGGQLSGVEAARGLANVPLVWMLEKVEARGLTLPEGWRDQVPADPNAPSVGTWQGWGKMFLFRKARVILSDRSEAVHETAISHVRGGDFRGKVAKPPRVAQSRQSTI